MWRVLVSSAAVLTAALATTACAHADPEPAPPGPPETAAPQPDSPCAENLADALTPAEPGATGNNRLLLHCQDGSWQQLHDPYPSSDRWLTTGPELVLHGQGRRNPEAKAGNWTADPQTAQARCSVERVDVLGAGETSEPETFTADPGRPLTFEISDHMYTVKLGGYCLWQRD